jgi:hypothetical protein
MSITWRIVTLICITWCLVSQLYFVAVPLAVWYLFKVDGHELILVSILVDGYYQAFYSLPILSIATIGLIIFFDFIKPQLLMYTGGNEMVS